MKKRIPIPRNLKPGDQLLLDDGDVAVVSLLPREQGCYFTDDGVICAASRRDKYHDLWEPNGCNTNTERYVVGIKRKRKKLKKLYDIRDDKPLIAVSYRFIRDVKRWKQRKFTLGNHDVIEAERLLNVLAKYID